MPIVKQMMDSLMKEYGSKKGQEVYFALENKRKAMKTKIDAKNPKK